MADRALPAPLAPGAGAYSLEVLRQNPRLALLATLVALVIFALCLRGPLACDSSAPPASPQAGAGSVRIASLVPAATNMLLELHQRDKLVAVSNYDTDPRVEGLPRVGDLQDIDWEQIAAARPTHMIVQMSQEKTPRGAIQRAGELNVQIVHIRIERLGDIAATIDQLEKHLGAGDDQAEWRGRFERTLAAAQVAGDAAPPVPTLVALAPDFSFVAGRNNYLDDILKGAGGINVVPEDMAAYPNLDREKLLSLRPARIALIFPDATEAQLAEAQRTLESLAPAWGLAWDDVILITDGYAMVPGWSVIDISRRLRDAFSKDPAVTRPATKSTAS